MIEENSEVRLVISDAHHERLIVHSPEPNGDVVVTINSPEPWADGYGAVYLASHEREALLARLQGFGPRCPVCINHPGWATGDESKRREPADVCRTCLGSGTNGVKH